MSAELVSSILNGANGRPDSTLAITITPELTNAITYTNEVDEAYGLDNTDTTFEIETLPYGVGGATDLKTGRRTYTDTLPPGMDYELVVEHEAFHKKQIQVAEEMGLSSDDLMGIVCLLEGQTASILNQEIYPQERRLYEYFMSLDKEELLQGPYKDLRKYLEAVEEEAMKIDLHPSENNTYNLTYTF